MHANRIVAMVSAIAMAVCVTARVEDEREETTGLLEGETVVVMAKSYHQGNETEAD